MRALIFANGSPPQRDDIVHLLHSEMRLICADGGANIAAQYDLKPHEIVGDLDSIAPGVHEHFKKNETSFITFPADKDETDLEIALHRALELGCDEVVLFAGLGGRIDHELANIHLCAREEFRKATMVIHDHTRQCGALIVLHGPVQLNFRGTKDATFSLIPLSPQVTGINLTGARWQMLNDATTHGASRTMSNRIAAETVSLSIEHGCMLASVPLETWKLGWNVQRDFK